MKAQAKPAKHMYFQGPDCHARLAQAGLLNGSWPPSGRLHPEVPPRTNRAGELDVCRGLPKEFEASSQTERRSVERFEFLGKSTAGVPVQPQQAALPEPLVKPPGITVLWRVVGMLFVLGVAQGWSQLAVTEVMSWSSTNTAGAGACGCGTDYLPAHADFWELTNFGTNAMDLTGYLFCDGNQVFPDAAAFPQNLFFSGVTIQAGESIVLVRADDGTLDAAEFHQRWGAVHLPANLQIVFYPRYLGGFDKLGDAVQFGDPASNRVHCASVGEARRGISFTYDPVSGEFGVASRCGVDGAFRAANSCDIGSPGHAPGPVPLAILEQPASQEVDAGMAVTLSVRANGLPRPRYQWTFNGASISGAHGLCYTIPNITPAHAGQYQVILDNGSAHGLERLVSTPAMLTVNTNPTLLTVFCPPVPVEVTPGQTATLAAGVRAYPPPVFQWNFEGTVLAGETNRTLTLPSARFEQAGRYTLRIQHGEMVTNLSAWLAVRPAPRLWITEVMADPGTNQGIFPHEDWWELTNLDNYSVNLRGYRWDDFPARVPPPLPPACGIVVAGCDDCAGNSGGGVVLTNDLIVQPGESIVFASGITPAAFRAWWGEANLPPGLQIITYHGNNFDWDGDEIKFWNPTASAELDYVDAVAFSTSPNGVSLWFAPHECAWFGAPSVAGEYGAVQAAVGGDVGSPGRYCWATQITRIQPQAQGAELAWNSWAGTTYGVQYKTNLSDAAWQTLGAFPATGPSTAATVAWPNGVAQGYFRLQFIPEIPCVLR